MKKVMLIGILALVSPMSFAQSLDAQIEAQVNAQTGKSRAQTSQSKGATQQKSSAGKPKLAPSKKGDYVTLNGKKFALRDVESNGNLRRYVSSDNDTIEVSYNGRGLNPIYNAAVSGDAKYRAPNYEKRGRSGEFAVGTVRTTMGSVQVVGNDTSYVAEKTIKRAGSNSYARETTVQGKFRSAKTPEDQQAIYGAFDNVKRGTFKKPSGRVQEAHYGPEAKQNAIYQW